MTRGLLPGADRDLVDILAKRIETMCEAVLLNTKVVGDEGERKDGIAVTFEGEAVEPRGADVRSRAGLGRPPAELGDSRARQDAGPGRRARLHRGRRAAAARREPSIFAIGDVAGEPMLAHKASHEGRVAVEAIAGDERRVRAARRFRPSSSPIPEIAWAGLTETEAREAGPQGRRSRKFPWGASGRAITLDRTDGLTKLSSIRRPSACSASASSAPAPAS